MSVGHLYVFFGKMSIQVFSHFLIGLLFFFNIELSGFFVCFGYLLLIRYILCKYLLPFICCSVTKSCPTLCYLMDCSTPGFPVLHCLLEIVQTHVHWVDDAIRSISSSVIPFSSCPQSFPSIRVFSNELTFCIRWPKYLELIFFSEKCRSLWSPH